MRLFKIMSKHFKLLFRSKRQAILIVFGPILLTILIGLAFSNKASFDLNIGTYSPQNTSIGEKFTESLKQKFEVISYSDKMSCIQDVKERITHACVEFPEDFQIGVEGKNEISYHIDYSNLNLVGAISGALTEVSSTEAGGLSTDLTNDLLSKIENTRLI